MTTQFQRDRAARKLISIFILCVLCALCGKTVFGQTYVASFTPDTNSAPADSFHLWYQPENASDTNRWFWISETPGTNTSLQFTAPASNPARLAVTANIGATNQSAYSEAYLFDTNNFVVAKQLNLFPPRFLKVTRKP